MLWWYLQNETHLGSMDLSLLHLGPEEVIERCLRTLPRLKYVTVDLNPSSLAKVCADITNLPFADDRFDVVVCSHVLEHVPDDRNE